MHARPPTPRAALLGLLGALSCGGTGSAAPPAVDFDQERAWVHLEAMVALGPRPAGSRALEETRAYIEGELRDMGLEPVREPFEADTPVGPIPMANIVVDLPGPAEDSPLVVLCTHYETKLFDFEFVGANDGGSGTAVLIELARLLAARDNPLAYRILFLDGEEAIRRYWADPDNRYGSRHHVEQLERSGLLPRVKACVLLDLVGDKKLRLTHDEFSDSQFLAAFFDAARENGLGAHVGARRQPVKDDHLSFMDAGIRSVDLIDLDYGPNNRHWHSPGDTLENVSADSLGVIGRIVLLGLPRLEQQLLP